MEIIKEKILLIYCGIFLAKNRFFKNKEKYFLKKLAFKKQLF
jgi:hypothetical protein